MPFYNIAAYEPNGVPASLDAPLLIVDWDRYYGEILYGLLEKEIAGARTLLEESGMWHPAFTASKVTGMLISAGYSVAELQEFVTNSAALGEVAMEALDILQAQIPLEGATAPVPMKPHPAQKLPVYTMLEGPAAHAIRTMRPLFT
jgi:hypothetical protein